MFIFPFRYVLSASKEYPGKFLLSYLPNKTVRHEYVTTVADGFRYRSRVFRTLNDLLKWFKEHFRDPLPSKQGLGTFRGEIARIFFSGATVAATPMDQASYIGKGELSVMQNSDYSVLFFRWK